MKIEKITDNKIRIVVKIDELSNKNINLNDFIKSNVESQKFLLEILNKAEKEIGFNTNNCKLLIEAFTSLEDFYVFTITKIKKENKHTYKYKVKQNNSILKNPIYKFSSFEEFCNLCEAVNNSNISTTGISKNISLYLYQNTYYLIFSNLNLSYTSFKKLFSIINEFCFLVRKKDNFEYKLIEYGKPIIKQNALKTGIKYFV